MERYPPNDGYKHFVNSMQALRVRRFFDSFCSVLRAKCCKPFMTERSYRDFLAPPAVRTGAPQRQRLQAAHPQPKVTFRDAENRELRRQRALQLASMDAYTRHKKIISDYVLYYGKQSAPQPTGKTDYDILKEQYRFIRTAEDDEDIETNWDKRLAKKYYDKLFKEYCIADLSHYKEGAIGLRWRVEREVFSGKGQFVCGNKHCDRADGLNSFEVNFAYIEDGKHKNALVKLRLCPECAGKLSYYKDKLKRKKEKHEQRKRKRDNISETTSEEASQKRQKIEDEEHKLTDTRSGAEDETSAKARADEEAKAAAAAQASEIWSQKHTQPVEKSKDEEFEEYFEGLFL